MHPQVDEYFVKLKQWHDELQELRSLLLDTELVEEYKWRAPCYTLDGKNVVILASFKEACMISFFKGTLLKDPKGLLQKPGENTQAARVVRFSSVAEVLKQKSSIKKLIQEAIAVEKSGEKVAKTTEAEPVPEELHAAFQQHPALEKAFEALTPGRQRAYLMHFAAAKQSKTRTARIEACTERILDGKGLHDCTCGLSKRMPGCDGSHKSLA
ncbi:YdeI/OmpD-associated family protein [Bremerella cremea]|uniref:YdeI/OmpD-associated family protein n=1 Tax=Bremerella cremea TaxID=1031537 RepID=UPI0031EB3B91